jgi:cytochrome P450
MSQQEPPKYDILSPTFFADPHATLHRMRAEDPVYWHPLLHSWVLTRYDDILRVLRDGGAHYSAKRVEQYGVGAPPEVQEKLAVCNRFISRWVAFVDPPEHTRLRALIARAFTVQAVDRLRGQIQAHIGELLAGVRDRGRMDLLADFAVPLPMFSFSALMGISLADTARLKEYVHVVFGMLGAGLPTAEIIEASYVAVQGLEAYFTAEIARRRRGSTEDLLSKLIEARVDDNALSDDEVIAMCVTLVVAGHETVSNMIGNAVLTLLRHPDQLAKLRQSPKLVDGAVEEAMRFDGPTFATFRRAIADDTIGDTRIEAGQFVLSVLYAANRDPERFPDPDRFDIERPDNNRHVSFSSGIHTCPGAALSRLQGRLALPALFDALPGLRLADEPLEWPPNMMLRGVRTLPVVWDV